MKKHQYSIQNHWTGNLGTGTDHYRHYSRDHEINLPGKKHTIQGSSDPAFRGDPGRYNPEELLVASISSCHMLWYLHLCAVNKVVVVDYTDEAIGVMEESKVGSGRFAKVTLYPKIRVTDREMFEKARSLHAEAHRMCFIANSCNFPINHEVTILLAE